MFVFPFRTFENLTEVLSVVCFGDERPIKVIRFLRRENLNFHCCLSRARATYLRASDRSSVCFPPCESETSPRRTVGRARLVSMTCNRRLSPILAGICIEINGLNLYARATPATCFVSVKRIPRYRRGSFDIASRRKDRHLPLSFPYASSRLSSFDTGSTLALQ